MPDEYDDEEKAAKTDQRLRRVATSGVVEPGYEDQPAPGPVRADGQHTGYWVLSEEERLGGYVRPVRRSYVHAGPPGPKNLRPLTPEELVRYAKFAYVSFESYPADGSAVTGRYWTQAQLDAARAGGCGQTTTMALSIAQTYARDPHFYGATFCVFCRTHRPVGPAGEFVWADGSGERVGT